MTVRTLPRALAIAATLFGLGLCPALAQTSGWLEEKRSEEDTVTPPERFNAERLISFTVSAGSELRFGVDPDTVSVGKDGVVRYVLVARSSSGLNNVLYQGLRCGAAEFRTYAIWHAGEGWRAQADASWKGWGDTSAGTPAMRLAREAFCDGRYPNEPVSKMLSELRHGKPQRR